ncbi:MAG: hypothetical protein MUF38_01545 [Anaerolineae bacterium]|jgi:hypothetical protein|nr:hypothetical protein [Anaerolineae bacterium]
MTIKELFELVCDEDDPSIWTYEEKLELIADKFREMKDEIRDLELELDEYKDQSERVTDLEYQLERAQMVTIPIEDVLYDLCIPNPFNQQQIILIDNHIADRFDIEYQS